jgi:hypothetical protein
VEDREEERNKEEYVSIQPDSQHQATKMLPTKDVKKQKDKQKKTNHRHGNQLPPYQINKKGPRSKGDVGLSASLPSISDPGTTLL